MEIVTPDETYSYLGIQDALDARMRLLVNQLVGYAERAVRQFVGRTLTPATWTHFFPTEGPPPPRSSEDAGISVAGTTVTFGGGGGVPFIQLLETPVRSITNVWEDTAGFFGDVAGAFAAATLLTPGTHYFMEKKQAGLSESGRLFRRGGTWPSELGSVKIEYVAGYVDQKSIPYDFKMGILMQTASYWARAKDLEGGGPGKETLSDSIASVSASYGNELGMMQLCRPAERLLWPRRKIRRQVA